MRRTSIHIGVSILPLGVCFIHFVSTSWNALFIIMPGNMYQPLRPRFTFIWHLSCSYFFQTYHPWYNWFPSCSPSPPPPLMSVIFLSLPYTFYLWCNLSTPRPTQMYSFHIWHVSTPPMHSFLGIIELTPLLPSIIRPPPSFQFCHISTWIIHLLFLFTQHLFTLTSSK